MHPCIHACRWMEKPWTKARAILPSMLSKDTVEVRACMYCSLHSECANTTTAKGRGAPTLIMSCDGDRSVQGRAGQGRHRAGQGRHRVLERSSTLKCGPYRRTQGGISWKTLGDLTPPPLARGVLHAVALHPICVGRRHQLQRHGGVAGGLQPRDHPGECLVMRHQHQGRHDSGCHDAS